MHTGSENALNLTDSINDDPKIGITGADVIWNFIVGPNAQMGEASITLTFGTGNPSKNKKFKRSFETTIRVTPTTDDTRDLR